MSETVSIIDDEASVRDAVTMLLETNGYAVASYASVGEFLSAPFTPGAVVSDVRMPEATGLDLLRSAPQVEPLALAELKKPRSALLHFRKVRGFGIPGHFRDAATVMRSVGLVGLR